MDLISCLNENIKNLPIISNLFTEDTTLLDLKEKFDALGYVKLYSLFTDNFLQNLEQEVQSLSKKSIEKNFVMPGYSTPRKLSILGGKFIQAYSPLLTNLYKNEQLKRVISKIIGKQIYSIDHQEECMVINFIEKKGGTHGWHLDDPQYALVMIIQSPESSEGGYLEIIPHWKQYAESKNLDPIKDTNQLVSLANNDGLIRKINHNAGECYLLNAGDCLHRVAPVNCNTFRTVVNFAFDYRQSITFNGTADLLYGGYQHQREYEQEISCV